MKWYVSSAAPSSSSSWSSPLALRFWGLAFSFPLDDLVVGLGLAGEPLVLARLAGGGWVGSCVDLDLSLARWARREVIVSAFRAPRMSAGLIVGRIKVSNDVGGGTYRASELCACRMVGEFVIAKPLIYAIVSYLKL